MARALQVKIIKDTIRQNPFLLQHICIMQLLEKYYGNCMLYFVDCLNSGPTFRSLSSSVILCRFGGPADMEVNIR